MKYQLWQLIVIFLLITSCKKESDVSPASNTTPLIFSSLLAESDTILTGTKTKISAIATGANLSYKWEGPVGIITGSGHEVFFFACCPGDHYITCTVTDSNGNNDSKTINVYGL